MRRGRRVRQLVELVQGRRIGRCLAFDQRWSGRQPSEVFFFIVLRMKWCPESLAVIISHLSHLV